MTYQTSSSLLNFTVSVSALRFIRHFACGFAPALGVGFSLPGLADTGLFAGAISAISFIISRVIAWLRCPTFPSRAAYTPARSRAAHPADAALRVNHRTRLTLQRRLC